MVGADWLDSQVMEVQSRAEDRAARASEAAAIKFRPTF